MINKIYKYRPLSDFLFKELYYQEIYFASYSELNDPLDLHAKINFYPRNKDEIKYLLNFIVKSQCFDFSNPKSLGINEAWIELYNNDEKCNIIIDEIFEKATLLFKKNENIWCDDIVEIISDSINDKNIVFASLDFKQEIERLTNKFLKSSYVTCFSETNNNFLMWSHYSSKHSGICLEFNLNHNNFPYEIQHKRVLNEVKFKQQVSEWDTKTLIFWSNLKKVEYEEMQPFINFYHFAPVFQNEHDCDLLGLSKSWTYKYAFELENLFSTKTKSWEYENEWRAIEINFENQKFPEERIRHYPIECLSAIYFGINTPEEVKNRIYKILYNKNHDIDFFEAELNGTNMIEFKYWECKEDY